MVRSLVRKPVLWVALALVVVLGAAGALGRGEDRQKLRLSQLERLVAEKGVRSAQIEGDDKVVGQLDNGRKFETKFPAEYGDELTRELLTAGIDLDSKSAKGNVWLSLILNLLPIALVLGAILYLMNSMQGGGNRVMQFGKAKPKQVSQDGPKVTFADIAGADEAIEELVEIKEFLKSPGRFQATGAKIPKGVLLFGPPGTGKTLLARAVAGEAGVPFYSLSGSDFVEMFVGVGASRVRDLFEQAKTHAPSIIFVDEIDAVGRHRGAGVGGGHDEREQTLNQLLVEMDGFDTHAGVILIAATNRPDILDPALLRPGRFDRHIVVDRPDIEGRKQILGVHARGKPIDDAVDLAVLARRTPGFTGADLANLLNEAALLAARHGRSGIGMVELETAIDRVIGGPERKTRVMSEKEKLVIAYHEGGHALVGHVLPHADPVHKVSILARGRALGWTISLPTADKYIVSRSELRDQLTVLMGGRTAEELIFDEITTGAANDIEKASEIARAMVTQYGMSDVLGPLQLGQQGDEVFLGRDMNHHVNYSDQMAAHIDVEVRALIDGAHDVAVEILEAHRSTLDRLASSLMEEETLDTPELMAILGDLPPWPARTPALAPQGVSAAAATEAPIEMPREAPEGAAAKRGRRRVPRPRTKPATA